MGAGIYQNVLGYSESCKSVKDAKDVKQFQKMRAAYKTESKRERPVKEIQDVDAAAREIPGGEKPTQDILEISKPQTWNAQEWRMAVQGYLESLERNMPGLHISTVKSYGAGANSAKELEKSVQSVLYEKGRGVHLLISAEFYSAMEAGPEEFDQYKQILQDVIQQLAGSEAGKDWGNTGGAQESWNGSYGAYLTESSVRYWVWGSETEQLVAASRVEAMNQTEASGVFASNTDKTSTNSAKKNGNSVNIKVSAGNSDYDTAGKYAKMARAMNQQQVRLVLSEVNVSISNLRMVACIGEAAEKKKASMVIRSLQKLLRHGRKKIKRFDAERVVEMREKSAMEQKLKKKVEQLRKELNQKKRKRWVEDERMLEEGKQEERRINAAMQQYEQEYARAQSIASQSGAAVSGEAAVSGAADGSMEMGEGGALAVSAEIPL